MTLAPGARLGAYEILSLLGAGGMGEVYRARDTRLNRDVAIKVLPELFAADADRLARFKREAQVLASLNHPHIAAIYGLEETNVSGGSQVQDPPYVRALILELVDGPTLADRIARGPIPIDEALPIARQIAEALEGAHEHGIIHRDLKPANIKLTPDGNVKVLDFGLAKATDAGSGPPSPQATAGKQDPAYMSQSPTITSPAMTLGGVILGTAAYMSPEQARGKVLDKRSDIWAFGCVLFEMLTAKSAFVGDDVSLTLSKILQREAEWAALPSATPAGTRHLLQRCLEKDPTRRLRDIGEARIALQDSALLANPGVALVPHVKRSKRARGVAAIALLAAVAIAFAGGYASRGDGEPASRIHFSMSLPTGHALISGPAITRDGRRIAYVSSDGIAPQRLYVKELDEFEGRAIPGTDGAAGPFFSPDGRWIAFFARGRLFRQDLEGGAPVELADAPSPMGGTWREDDTLVFTPTWNGGLYRMSASGGKPELLIRPDKKLAYAYTWPYFLPGGRELLFTTWGASFSIARLSLPGLEQTLIAPGFGNKAAYAASGHLLPVSYAGQLQAIPYREGAAIGRASPVTVVDKLHWAGLPGSGESAFAVSLNGTLVYAPGDITQRSLAFVDQTGHAMPAARQYHAYTWIRLAPDGRRVALAHDGQIWIQELERGLSTPLAPELRGGHQGFPIWTPDGLRVIFASQHEGNWELYSKPASGAGSAEVVLKKEFDQFPLSMAADGTLVFSETRPGSGYDIWVLPTRGEPAPWLATPAEELDARVSPDGRLLVYSSDESGRREIYVQPFRGSRDRLQVSTDGGIEPAWSPNGSRIFYRQGNTMMAVDLIAGGRLAVGKPTELFHAGWEHGTGRHTGNHSSFSVLPDGKRFLMLDYEPAAIPTRLNIILNWFDELTRRVPTN